VAIAHSRYGGLAGMAIWAPGKAHIDQRWPASFQSVRERLDQFFVRIDTDGVDAHALRQADPVDGWTGHLRQLIQNSPALQSLDRVLQLKDGVPLIVGNDGDDVQLLPRLRPQCLQGVHCAPVALKINHHAVGASDGRTNGGRRTEADGPATQAEMRKWWRRGGIAPSKMRPR
jgi:hypothetical protein